MCAAVDQERAEKTQQFLARSAKDILPEAAAHAIDDLIALIRYHNELYYVYAQPIIADVQYDHLFSLLVELEKTYPDYIRPDSPTQRLAINLQKGFSKANHGGFHVLSLQNTYDATQIRERYEFLLKQLPEGEQPSFVVEPKFDGSSVHLIYTYGKFSQAISRGDGTIGEDITENIKVVRNLPWYLPGARDLPVLRCRAEVVMTKQTLEKLNTYQQEEGLPLFANTRNATAGSLRQLDPHIVAQRNLLVFVHELLTWQEIGSTSHREVFEFFAAQKLPFDHYEYFTDIEKLIAYCTDEKTRQKLLQANIEFDGLVIKLDSLQQREQLGVTAHHPRWAIAYKFPALQVATQLVDITYQVGRTGVITPVATLAPVQLSGATISRATLHNFDYLQNNDIRLGDYVRVQRSGEVIPYVVGPIPARRQGNEQPFVRPTHCPACGTSLQKEDEEGVAWYCPNRLCDAQIKERFRHFVAKGCMNIEGLGTSIIDTLVDAELIRTPVDLYTLHFPEKRLQLHSLPGLATKKVEQILTQLEASKRNPVWRLLHALGIPFVGKKVATMLEHYLADQQVATAEELIKALTDQEALSMLYGLGPQTIQALSKFFGDEVNRAIFHGLVKEGINILPVPATQAVATGTVLQGMSCVITGSFPFSRETITHALEQAGVKVTATVTSKTDRLLAGEKAGSKYEKAQTLGIPIYSWDEAKVRFAVLAALKELPQAENNATSQKPAAPSLFGE